MIVPFKTRADDVSDNGAEHVNSLCCGEVGGSAPLRARKEPVLSDSEIGRPEPVLSATREIGRPEVVQICVVSASVRVFRR